MAIWFFYVLHMHMSICVWVGDDKINDDICCSFEKFTLPFFTTFMTYLLTKASFTIFEHTIKMQKFSLTVQCTYEWFDYCLRDGFLFLFSISACVFFVYAHTVCMVFQYFQFSRFECSRNFFHFFMNHTMNDLLIQIVNKKGTLKNVYVFNKCASIWFNL